VQEQIKWGAPAYTLGGKILVITASFKAHAAINFWRGQELGFDAADGAMGQLGKLTSVDELPRDFDRMIARAAQLSGAPAARKTKHAPKAPPEMHPEFAAALTKTPKAKAAFDGFPPSAQRDYLEWIAEAKQDGTREKRIASALEWLSEGKRRHWKYQSC
jgi:uncharacterized protein YdeI (YjbR/CyaY-like superfamily)